MSTKLLNILIDLIKEDKYFNFFSSNSSWYNLHKIKINYVIIDTLFF